jgi:hypothetical protein
LYLRPFLWRFQQVLKILYSFLYRKVHQPYHLNFLLLPPPHMESRDWFWAIPTSLFPLAMWTLLLWHLMASISLWLHPRCAHVSSSHRACWYLVGNCIPSGARRLWSKCWLCHIVPVWPLSVMLYHGIFDFCHVLGKLFTLWFLSFLICSSGIIIIIRVVMCIR